MRVFSHVPTAQTISSTPKKRESVGRREVERQTAVKTEDFETKVMKDPRMKKYSRPTHSESEIRDKLKSHIEKLAANTKKTVAATPAKTAAPAEEAGDSDISKNDPTNTNTREKLKEAVTMGTFNFSDKERQVLNQILQKNS